MAIMILSSKNSPTTIKKLTTDLLRILDGTKETHFDSKSQTNELIELMDLNECENSIYLESTKRILCLWLANHKGPSIKLELLAFSTLSGFQGNFFEECGAVILFESGFEDGNFLIFKNLIEKMLKNDKPKDRCLCFYRKEESIHMRCYNIKDMEEIGMRIEFKIIKILSGLYNGTTLYNNRSMNV